MPSEPVTIDAAGDQRRTTTGKAEDVARYSDAARIAIGTLWIVGGFAGGAMFIVVPIVHLVSTWALPLGGILLGMRAFKRRVVLYNVAGTCPACGEAVEFVRPLEKKVHGSSAAYVNRG